MNRQEIFTKTVLHLRAQGRPAMDAGDCLYRAPDGTACAIGCHLPDETAAAWDHSGASISMLWNRTGSFPGRDRASVLESFPGIGSDGVLLLAALQRAHDAWPVGDSFPESSFADVARKYGLTMPPADHIEGKL
jgi:hypothetical protein